jgi:hypothetical protein
MSALSIQIPYPIFTDKNGQPLNDGNIYIGTANLDPVNNPIAVFWDAALTIPAAQPIKTSGGYPVYQGTPARLYVNSNYSILVRNKKGITLYTAPSATERYNDVVIGDVDASNVVTIASESLAVQRTQESVNNDTLSVFDFMTPTEIADVRSNLAGINVTAALQTAINAAASSGKRLLFPAGRYLTNGLVVPGQEAGRVFLDLDTKAVLQAATAGITVINMGGDIARLGPRIIRGGRIDGMNLANVIGIQTGGDSIDILTVALYNRIQDVTVTGCYEAVVTRNSQELICDGLICFANTIGFVALSSSVAGGSTVFQFYGCRFQNNRVNFFGKSNSVFPIGGWLFSGCTFQNGLLAGLALYGGQSGNGALVNISLENCHFEGSGVTTNPGDTETVRGQVVVRGNIILTGTRLSANSGELGANIVPSSFIMRENAVLSVSDSNIGGGPINQFDVDATSKVYLQGKNVISGGGGGIEDWSGFNWDGVSSGGVMSGFSLIAPAYSISNDYAGTGLFPNAPEASVVAGASVSKVLDQHQGLVQRVAYLASVGSTGANSVILAALPMSFAVGDRAVFSTLARASVDTVITLTAIGGTSGLASGTVALAAGVWTRIVLYGRATAIEGSGFNVFVFPNDTAGANVDFTKMMVKKLPSAAGTNAINEVIQNGLYDDLLSPIYGDAIPASGTYPRGKQIIARAPSVGAARGWVKVTQGSANVLGVDWINLGNL